MQRKLWVIASVIAMWLVVSIAGPAAAAAAPAAQGGPQTWTVLVGAESKGGAGSTDSAGAWQFMRFYPDSITINAGDSIVWKSNAGEFHAVNFLPPGQKSLEFIQVQGQDLVLNPQVIFPSGGATFDPTTGAGSGLIGREAGQVPEYKLTFNTAGTYGYVCAIHSALDPASGLIMGMTGTVIVQPAGSPYPKTQAQIDADAAAMIAADGAAAQAVEGQATTVPGMQPGPNGGMIHTVNVGYDAGIASYMRFAPADFTIKAGDTVTWKQTSAMTPHTVTLLGEQKTPDLTVAEPQASGPPRVKLNPAILAPAGGATYIPASFASSGFLPGMMDPAPGPRDYSLTFTMPGTYVYICMLHAGMGMSGTITVLGGTAPGMPTTGHTDAAGLLLALAGLALLLGGVALRRRLAPR
jgi:plastocyanin